MNIVPLHVFSQVLLHELLMSLGHSLHVFSIRFSYIYIFFRK
jgi:hypothetical protein